MAQEKLYSRTLVTTFLLFLLIPSLVMVVGRNESISQAEKRKLAEFPSFDWSLEALDRFPKEFDDYFQDHFGLRDSLITFHNSIFTKIFASSPNHDVIWGRNGWLYLASSGILTDYLGQGITRETTIRKFGDELADRRRWLAAKNIRYLFVPVPNKIQVYPENLPDLYQHHADTSMYNRLVDHAEKRGDDVPLLNLLPDMKERKEFEQLYFQTDTHWNSAGGYLGYTKIVDYISRWFPDQSPLMREDLAVRQKKYSGDLASLVHLEKHLSEQVEEFFIATPCKGGKFYSRKSHKGDIENVLISECRQRPLTAVILQDSFGYFTAPFFSQHFGTAYYFYGWNFRNIVPYLDEFRPDVIIDLHVLRNVPKTLRPRPDITRAAAELLYEEAPITFLDLANDSDISHDLQSDNIEFNATGPPGEFEADSNDPQMFFSVPTLLQAKDLVIRVNIVSPVDTSMQLFFSNRQEPFTEENSVSLELKKGANDVYTRIPGSSEIRFDPGKQPGIYRLNVFSIKGFNP